MKILQGKKVRVFKWQPGQINKQIMNQNIYRNR